jgi:hypothetical protein
MVGFFKLTLNQDEIFLENFITVESIQAEAEEDFKIYLQESTDEIYKLVNSYNIEKDFTVSALFQVNISVNRNSNSFYEDDYFYEFSNLKLRMVSKL